MSRIKLAKLHGLLGCLAFLTIATFWVSTAMSELFLSPEAVAVVKKAIVYAFLWFIPVIAATGVTGFKLAGKSKYPLIMAKSRRMPIIVGLGILILIPSALFLNFRAQDGSFDTTFYFVQALELLVGAINLYLMGSNIRDGFSIRRKEDKPAV